MPEYPREGMDPAGEAGREGRDLTREATGRRAGGAYMRR